MRGKKWMKQQQYNKDEASSGPLAELLVQVHLLQECNRKIIFIQHQWKIAPVEEKRPSVDLVLVSSSSISPSVSPLVRHVGPWWSAGGCERSKWEVKDQCVPLKLAATRVGLAVVMVTMRLQWRGPNPALLKRHKAGSSLGPAHLASHHRNRALPTLQVDLDALLQTPEHECEPCPLCSGAPPPWKPPTSVGGGISSRVSSGARTTIRVWSWSPGRRLTSACVT